MTEKKFLAHLKSDDISVQIYQMAAMVLIYQMAAAILIYQKAAVEYE